MDTKLMTINSTDDFTGDFTVEIESYDTDVRITKETAQYLFNQLKAVLDN